MTKIDNLHDEYGRLRYKNMSEFDNMTDEEAEAVFGDEE